MRPKYTPNERNDIDVKDELAFKDFCEDRELADRTIQLYRMHLNKYCNFIGKTLEELLDEAEEEQENNVRMRKRKINRYLKDYRRYLTEAGYKESTIKMRMIDVMAFFGHYDIIMAKPKRKLSRKAKIPKNIQDIKSIPTLEEIQRFMECLNEVYRVVLLFGVSSGMGSSEIGSLTYKDLYEACELYPYPKTLPELIEKLKNKGHFIPTWRITRVKTGVKYFTFTSPELMKHLIIYLELYNKKYPNFIPKPENHLLRSLKRVGVGKSYPIVPQVIAKRFWYTNEKHGFRKYKGKYVLVSHGFRKYFATTLEKSKMPHLIIRKLLAHNIDNTTGAYFKIDEKTAKKEYIEVVNELSTDKVEVQQINIYEDIENIKLDMVKLKKKIG